MVTTKIDIWNKALTKIGETDLIESEDDDETTRPAVKVAQLHYPDIIKEVLAECEWPFATRQRPLGEISEQSTTTAYADAGSYTIFEVLFAYLDSSQLTVTRIASGGAETELTAGTDYTIDDAEVDGENNTVTLTSAITTGQSLRITVTTSRVGWEYLYSLPSDCVTPMAILAGDARRSLLPFAGMIDHEVVLGDDGESYVLCCDLPEDDVDALEYITDDVAVSIMPAHFVECVALRLAMEFASAIAKDEVRRDRLERSYYLALSAAKAVAQNVGHQGTPPVTPSVSVRE